jgi:multiple sugar transport system substrate-binding protein
MTPISRRLLLQNSCAAALSAAIAAAGCERRARQRTAAADGTVTLEFFNYTTSEFLRLYNERLIPAFHEAHPKIRIRMSTSLGDAGYEAKLLTLIAGGLPPDIVHVTQGNFPFFAAKGVLQPVDPFVAEDRSFALDSLVGQVVNGMRYGGALLGLPSDFSTIVMNFNVDLFDARRVPRPEPNWTWADFLDACRRLTFDADGDGHADVWGTAVTESYNRWPAWVWMNGGDIFSPDLSRCTMDTPQAIGGLEWYVDLLRTHHVAPTPAMSPEMESVRLQELFASSRLGVMAESRYQYKKYLLRGKGVPFALECAPMPRGPAGMATTFIWGGNCIMKGSPFAREAWEFLKFIAGPEGAAMNRAGANALPVHRASAEDEIAHPRHPRIPQHDRYFLDAIEYARIAPYPEQYADATEAMRVIMDALLGLKTVEQACRQMTAQINEILRSKVL